MVEEINYTSTAGDHKFSFVTEEIIEYLNCVRQIKVKFGKKALQMMFEYCNAIRVHTGKFLNEILRSLTWEGPET